MPDKIRVEASTLSSAQPEEIYALLVNSATYPLWSIIRYYESLRFGNNGLHGVGALRLFRTNAITVMHEEVTVALRDERVAYSLRSGFPLLDYRAQTTLKRVPSGTHIAWEASFYPKYHLTGWYWRRLMTWVLNRLVKDLAATAENAERRAAILVLAYGKASMSKRELADVAIGATSQPAHRWLIFFKSWRARLDSNQ